MKKWDLVTGHRNAPCLDFKLHQHCDKSCSRSMYKILWEHRREKLINSKQDRRSFMEHFSYKITSELDLKGWIQKVSQKDLTTTACPHIYTDKPSLRSTGDTAPTEVAIDYSIYEQIKDKEVEWSSLYLAFQLFQGWFLIKAKLYDVSTEVIWEPVPAQVVVRLHLLPSDGIAGYLNELIIANCFENTQCWRNARNYCCLIYSGDKLVSKQKVSKRWTMFKDI